MQVASVTNDRTDGRALQCNLASSNQFTTKHLLQGLGCFTQEILTKPLSKILGWDEVIQHRKEAALPYRVRKSPPTVPFKYQTSMYVLSYPVLQGSFYHRSSLAKDSQAASSGCPALSKSSYKTA